jgi:hypothetical protein
MYSESSALFDLLNATRMDLKVSDVVLGSLLRAKLDFGITRFALACTFQYVFEGDFLIIRSLCVRKDGILRNIVIDESDEAKFIYTLKLQKSHDEWGINWLQQNIKAE